MDVSSLHSILPEGEVAPEWVQLVPGGTFSGVDGRGPYTMPDAHAVIAASLTSGQRLVFDQDHATDHSLKSGIPAPARGWITALEATANGGIRGRVEWTAAGKQLLATREYRGVSPVFQHDAGLRVTRVLRASLTNAPNLDLPALHAKDPASMDLLAQLRAALGLPETADAPAAIAAVTAQRTAIAAHATQLATIAVAAGAKAGATADVIVTALQARGTGDDLPQVVAMQARIQELEQGNLRAAAEKAIDAAIAAGKPIPPMRRDDFIARHMKDPAGTDGWLADMPSLKGGGLGARMVVPPATTDASGLDHAELAMCSAMGLSPADFAKQKGELIAKGAIQA